MTFDESSLYNIKSLLTGMRHSLFDLAIWKNGLAFKKINFSDKGVPIIKIAELNNGIGGTTSFTQQTFSEDVHLNKGDLLFSWSGNPQTSIDIFRYNLKEGWLNQHIFKVMPNEELVDRDYFYFMMKNLKPYFTQIATNKQTTGLGHVTIADIKRMNVIIPTIKEQKKIVSIVKPIDEKIALNTAINENLEQQAQAFFEMMFPNVLNSNGNNTLEEIISFSNGKKRPEEKGNIPVFGGNGILAYTNKSNSFNCVVIGRVGAYCGNVSLCLENCWISDNAISAKSKLSESQIFIFYLLKYADLPNRHIGTGQPLMTQGILNSVPCIIPENKKIKEFENVCQPIYAMIFDNMKENENLVALRNTLLPKLMNGEIDISKIKIY